MKTHVASSSVDLVIADPPFGIEFDKVGKGGSYERNRNLVTDGYVEVPLEQYDQFTHDWMSQVFRCLKSTGTAYLFSGWSNLLAMLSNIDKVGFTTINHIIWRYQFGVFTKRKYAVAHYHVLFVAKDPDAYNFYTENGNEYIEDVWVFRRPYTKDEERYPTKLPPMLVEKCLKYSSRENDLVMDPFLGSGTTAVKAIGMRRRFVGFEKNAYCEQIYRSTLDDIECLQI
jgi:site-specific DNA-methyltransferase (adenine-specific)